MLQNAEMMAVVVVIILSIALIALARRIRGTPPVSSKTPAALVRDVPARSRARSDKVVERVTPGPH